MFSQPRLVSTILKHTFIQSWYSRFNQQGPCWSRPRGKRAGRRKQRSIKTCVNIFQRPCCGDTAYHKDVSQNKNNLVYPSISNSRTQTNESSVTNVNKSNFNAAINHSNLIYPNLKEFKTTQHEKNICVGYTNTQSSRNKAEQIKDIIEDNDLDIFCLTETWLSHNGDDDKIANMTPYGYKTKSFPREGRRGGGIAVIYRDIFNPYIRFNSQPAFEHSTFEAAEMAIDYKGTCKKFLIIYRPPISSNEATFLREFSNFITSFSIQGASRYVLGDFNLHYNKDTPTVRKIKDVIESQNLCQLINAPTQASGNTLDWLITRDEENIHASITDPLISDHKLITFRLRFSKPPKLTKNIQTRNIKRISMPAFKATLNQQMKNVNLLASFDQPLSTETLFLHDDHIHATTRDELDTVVLAFDYALRQTLDTHAPLTSRRITERTQAPWFNNDIKEAKVKKRKSERRWKKTALTIHKQVFSQNIQSQNKLIQQAKVNYYQHLFVNIRSCKEMFILKDELLGKQKKSPLPSITASECSEQFSSFFCDKVCAIRDELEQYAPEPQPYCFTGSELNRFEPVTYKEVLDTINESAAKSCELDAIPTALLKNCADVVIPPLVDIFNRSLDLGYVPESFKVALVTPLLKKTNLDEENFNNYRPVSNLLFISKILEKIVLKQLLKHLKSNKLLEPLQSAYRSGHSTETALLKVFNDLLIEADDGNVTLLSLLDLSSAFDTIDHAILLERLYSTFGIAGSVLKWCKSYLSDRYQIVKVDSAKSDKKRLDYGVPQGSVLGPILFTLYVQPLTGILELYNCHFHFYADDTQIYQSSPPGSIHNVITNVEECIDHVKQWMNANKLKLNQEKTEVIVTGTSQKLKQVIPNSVTFGDSRIVFEEKIKNLGIIIDKELRMTAYVNILCRSLYFILKQISSLRPFLTVEVTKRLVCSLILSKLDYCNVLLAGTSADCLSKLQRVQNNAARLILQKKKRDDATQLLKVLHWLPVKERIIYKVCTLCYKSLSDKSPQYISSLLHKYNPARELRSSTDHTRLEVGKAKLKTYGDKAFQNIGPKTWNTLPCNIRETSTLTSFKAKLKTHLFPKSEC